MEFITISPRDLDVYIEADNVAIIDLREEKEFARGHVINAINIPYEELEEKKEYLPKWKEILLYCERGNNSLQVARQLSAEGYKIINMYGGIHAYRGNSYVGKIKR